jgi:hypothetical protein
MTQPAWLMARLHTGSWLSYPYRAIAYMWSFGTLTHKGTGSWLSYRLAHGSAIDWLMDQLSTQGDCLHLNLWLSLPLTYGSDFDKIKQLAFPQIVGKSLWDLQNEALVAKLYLCLPGSCKRQFAKLIRHECIILTSYEIAIFTLIAWVNSHLQPENV